VTKAEVIYGKVQTLTDSAQAAVLRVVELLSDSDPSSPLEQKFHELAGRRRQETRYYSFSRQRALHPAYQQIIGLGWPVVPLLLRELRSQPERWFWALQAITGERPAIGAETIPAAAEAWLRWGRQHELTPDAGS